MSDPAYTVRTRIQKPIGDVFQAIIDEHSICDYFTESTSGPLVPGETITWHWSEWGDYPVAVVRLVDDSLIQLQIDSLDWKKSNDQEPAWKVDIFLELEAINDATTRLSISERGWPESASGLKGSHDNCSGWTHMAMCLKAFLEHGIDLR